MSVYHFFSNYLDNSCDNDALIFDMHNVIKMTSQCYHSIITKISMKYQNIIVWFQKISIPPPQGELEIPEGRGAELKTPGKSRGEGSWAINFVSRCSSI